MKARRVFLADGGTILTEAHEQRCWAAEEVASVEIELDDYGDEVCDICEQPIWDDAMDEVDEEGGKG